MRAICRFYERTDHGVKIVAEIRDNKVTGKKAASIRKILERYGFPDAPMEDVIDQFLFTSPDMGVAFIPPMDEEPKA
jgi:hypothetical protein